LTENDVFVLCGGDGTLNRFVNDTEGLDIPCDILYVASGTGNAFLNDIEKSKEDCPLSVKKYLSGLPTVTVKGNTYRFINNVGFGIDGYCCEVGDELTKKSDKPVNYTAIAIKGLLFHYKPTNATVIVDGKEHSYKNVWIAPTMKGRFYGGGMMATPMQDRTDADGKLSIMLFYGKGRLKTLMVFPSIFKGEHIKHKDMVTIHTGKEITVKFDRPAPLQIDGETILGVTEYTAYAKCHAYQN
jgi:diacylglycerol kinase family enzyme